MGAAIPKQYLELRGKPIATWSLETFLGMEEVAEVIIVCDPSWKHVFEDALVRIGSSKPVKFALPGAERQDSMTNGFKEIKSDAALVAIHDSARPLVTAEECQLCFQDALTVGAAVLGVPVKPTIKEIGADGFVVKTLQRSALWEVQTPQVIVPSLLQEGIELVARESLEVTDDVSIIESMGKPVKITKGTYTNIKVTTPDDMSVAERFLDERATVVAA